MKTQKVQHLKISLSVCLIFFIATMHASVIPSWASSSTPATDTKLIAANATETNTDIVLPPATQSAPVPEETKSDNTLLYSGIGIAALAGIAIAAGSGGGGSSDSEVATTTTTPTTTTTTTKTTTSTTSTKKKAVKTPEDTNEEGSDPVGADVAGDNWSGYIDLVGKQRQSITATISQNGTYIVIRTTSNQAYGKKLVGNIASDGFMLLYDQTTGEDWTTHHGNATDNRIDLYDYTNSTYTEVDQIFLQR